MGERPDDSYARAEAALIARGVTLDCPACPEREWIGPGELANLLVTLPLATPKEFFAVKDGETPVATVCYAFICANCGFVRLHAENVVNQERSE